MQYINPYKLLGITTENISEVDSAAIYKAKRKLLAEIELSETNAIVHSGVELNKGDCLKAIDDLDNNNKREFHLFILQNKPLYNFLTSRDLTFFTQFKVESIFKDNDFLDFISPYFSEQYDKALIINYKSNKINNLNALLSVKPITNFEYYERCYKSTYAFLRDINNDIEKINKDIENESSLFISQDFKGLLQTVSSKVNVSLLNALPSYFQSIRNQIAHSIRDVEVKLYNDPYNNYTIAYQLIEFAKNINSDGLTLQTITKSYYTVRKQYESCQSQTPILTNTSTTIQDEEDVIEEEFEQEIKKETKEKKNNYVFSLSIIAVLIIGFFYRPLQYFVLSIQIIIIVTGLFISLKKKDDNISYIKLFKNVMLLVVGGILGLFFPFVARIFISYYVLLFSAEFIPELFPKNENKKRKSWGFYPNLIGAIIITLTYHNYRGTDTNNFSREKKTNNVNNENSNELNTQKPFDATFPQESLSIKKSTNLKSKRQNEIEDNSNQEKTKEIQNTGEIKF